MLKLKNIKRNNGILSAEYAPESSDDIGTVSLNRKGEIVEVVLAKQDEGFPMYLHHAVQALKKLVDVEEIPTEKTIMWY